MPGNDKGVARVLLDRGSEYRCGEALRNGHARSKRAVGRPEYPQPSRVREGERTRTSETCQVVSPVPGRVGMESLGRRMEVFDRASLHDKTRIGRMNRVDHRKSIPSQARAGDRTGVEGRPGRSGASAETGRVAPAGRCLHEP
jgi:hypothetical protein